MATPKTDKLREQWIAGKLSCAELFEAVAKMEQELINAQKTIAKKDITISYLHELNEDLETLAERS